MTLANHIRNLLFRRRFGVLLLLLFLVILLPPYFGGSPWLGHIWRALFTSALLWTLYTVVGGRVVLLLAVVMLVPTVASTWLADGQATYVYLDNITNIVYLTLVCSFIFRYIFSTTQITLEVIFAAMCLYLILAILWAAIYTNIQIFYGDAFTFHGMTAAEAGIKREHLFTTMAYYSFVTISTLGYGEIVPVHRVAQNWAAVEAMIGQFFIAIVIARLVSMYSIKQKA